MNTLILLLILYPLSGDSPRVVEITAKRFAFAPNQVTLKKGQPVTLRITSEDVTHGIFSRPLGIDADIEPGKPFEITITPKNTGKFPTICHHFCGAQHGSMNMIFVVEE